MSPLSTDVSSSQNITIRYHFEVTFYRGASDGLWSTGSLMFTLINWSLNAKVSSLQLQIIEHFQISTHNPPWSLQGTRSSRGPKFLNNFWQQHSMGERMSFRVRLCTCPGFTAPPARRGGPQFCSLAAPLDSGAHSGLLWKNKYFEVPFGSAGTSGTSDELSGTSKTFVFDRI